MSIESWSAKDAIGTSSVTFLILDVALRCTLGTISSLHLRGVRMSQRLAYLNSITLFHVRSCLVDA